MYSATRSTEAATHELFSAGTDDHEVRTWLRRLQPVLTTIDQTRDPTEADRRSPTGLHRELSLLGVPRMWLSRTLGGDQVALTTGMRILLAIAERDPSISWQMGVQGAIGRLADYLPPEVAGDVFATHRNLVIGSVNPTGIARRTPDGGYTLSGRWSFASGAAHADWFVAAARIVNEDGSAVMTDKDTPEIVHLFVHRENVTIHDTWHTLGLRGTGSHDYTIEQTLVPAAYSVAGDTLFNPPPKRAGRAYPIAYHDFGPFTSSATALGIAVDAVTTFKELASSKRPAGGTSILSDSHTAQERFARAEADLHCARLALFHAAEQVEDHGNTGGDPLSALVRMTAATVADRAKAVVGTMNDLAGTTSIYTRSRLERCFRDIHTATKHITLSSSNFEMVGQYLLGGQLPLRR